MTFTFNDARIQNDNGTWLCLKVNEPALAQKFVMDKQDRLEDEAKTFRMAWEKLGTGWPTEQVDYDKDGERLVIRAYYGSSTYNTKNMSRLLDSVIEDCKEQDIETLPPDKLALMKEEWGH